MLVMDHYSTLLSLTHSPQNSHLTLWLFNTLVMDYGAPESIVLNMERVTHPSSSNTLPWDASSTGQR